jgi:hypothetical protein
MKKKKSAISLIDFRALGSTEPRESKTRWKGHLAEI